MIRLVIPILISLLLSAGGCGGGAVGTSTERTTTVTEDQAIDTAREAVRQHDSFADVAVFEAQPMGNGWRVTAEDERSGDERLIIIDSDGNVTKYQGG